MYIHASILKLNAIYLRMHQKVPFVLECEGVFGLAGSHHLPQVLPWRPGTSETSVRPEIVFWAWSPQVKHLNIARRSIVTGLRIWIKKNQLFNPANSSTAVVTTYFVLLLQEVVLTLYRLTHSGQKQQICLLELKRYGWLYCDRHTGRRSWHHPTSYSLQSSYLSGPSPLWDSAASLDSYIESIWDQSNLIMNEYFILTNQTEPAASPESNTTRLSSFRFL